MVEPLTIGWTWSPVIAPWLILSGGAVFMVITLGSIWPALSRTTPMAIVIATLRVVALAILAALLLNPVEQAPNNTASHGITPGKKPVLLLLVDTSRSMQTTDASWAGTAGSRLDAVKQRWLTTRHLKRLSEAFDLQLMSIDTSLHPIDLSNGLDNAMGKITADGNGSALRAGVARAVATLAKSRKQGGRVVLWSDGRDTASGETGAAVPGEKPADMVVDAIMMGDLSQQPRGNLRLVARGEPASLRVGESGELSLDLYGVAGAEATLTLRGTGSATQWQRAVRIGGDGRATLRVAIDAGGLGDGAMVANGWSNAGAMSSDDRARMERTTQAKNETRGGDWFEVNATAGGQAGKSDAFVARDREPVRVLVIDGRPNWDTRHLVRALTTMSDVEVSRAVATSLHGAANIDDLAVAVPSTVGGWAHYGVVILGGDVDSVMNVSRGESLAKYAVETGGRVLLTRGSGTVNGPHPAWLTAIEPVSWSGEVVGGGRLTWPGAAAPRDVSGRWERASLQPGANAWATIETDRGSWPAVVEAAAGRGRAVDVTGDGLWRWWLDETQTNGAYRQFWRRVIFGRLLGRDESGERPRLTVANPEGGSAFVGQRLVVEVSSMRDVDSTPKALTATIDGPLDRVAGETSTIALEIQSTEVGSSWRGTFVPSAPGVFRLSVPPLEPGDAAVTRTIEVLDFDRELADVSPEVAGLRAIVEPTGGVLIDAGAAADWSERLIHREALRHEVANRNGGASAGVEPMRSIWNRPWVMSLLIAMLLLEWLLRRWHGWR
jgi:hypothetical protein